MRTNPAEYDPEVPVIEAIRRGDPQALKELMDRHGRWVRGVIYGATGRVDDVDDVAQRVWMQVWREAGRLSDPRRWRVWLYRIARNGAADAGRARRRHKRLVGELSATTAPRRVAEPPERVLASQESQQLMQDAIASLPELYREPFVLKHLEGLSYQEIGEMMGLPTDTVETRLVRARRLLRQHLSGKV